ncbi:trypsin-like peptidase domain-containing protein, partial [Skermania pinensis]
MSDEWVPGYLGRVLDHAGAPIGTCFQVRAGVLVTAWHVLNDLGVGDVGGVVRVDALAGGVEPFPATVQRVDPVHDLAVLTTTGALGSDVVGWSATDWVERRTPVTVTGVVGMSDPEHSHRHLDALGEWSGGLTRDDQVPLGRLSASAVMRGMGGAPVRRNSDDVVVGVVSARYNSVDGWLRDSVMIARVENLEPLLAGVVEIEVDVRDLREARHQALVAEDAERAYGIAEATVNRLHTIGAYEEESTLIHDVLGRLSDTDPRRAAWYHQLGILAQSRGDYSEAHRQYQR